MDLLKLLYFRKLLYNNEILEELNPIKLNTIILLFVCTINEMDWGKLFNLA